MIHLNVVPEPVDWPDRGGVREHLRQLNKQAQTHPEVSLVVRGMSKQRTTLHVESAFTSPAAPDVYVCHGGFEPKPIPAVVNNLNEATMIISVAEWIVQRYFSGFSFKTIVIPNGVDLADWDNIPSSGLEPGYVLYAKEWEYFTSPLVAAAQALPDVRFVTTVWPIQSAIPKNVTIIGPQSFERMQSYVKDAGCLLITGPEVCPTMLLEAWAAKTPVAAWYVDGWGSTGSAELMTGAQPPLEAFVRGGRLFDKSNLAKTIVDVLVGSVELGLEGRATVEEYYQWKDLFEGYVEVYKSVERVRKQTA